MSRTRSEILIAKALREASSAALGAYLLLGVPQIAEPYGMALARVLTRAWAKSIRASVRAVTRDLGALSAKAEGDDLWQQFLDEYVRIYGGQAIMDILEATRAQIMARIEKGLRDGKGIDVIAKEIADAIPGMARLRAAVIARTETHSASQYASIETAKRYPFPVDKVWNSTADHRTRDFGEADGKVDQANHRLMNGVRVSINEPFMVPNKWGGFDPMQFPGDQNAPAYQCVNCRCAMTYKRVGRG